MDSNKKVKVTVVIKSVSDHRDIEITKNNNGDGFLEMNQLNRLLEKISADGDEQDLDKILHLLNATKTSNEVMASALVDAGREDLFDEKVNTINAVDEIINQIVNL
jgi:hypothetical protein